MSVNNAEKIHLILLPSFSAFFSFFVQELQEFHYDRINVSHYEVGVFLLPPRREG
jgi:hypothetical protein